MAHPLNYFDRIYVINLPNRSDRRKQMQRQLRRIGLGVDQSKVQFFPAMRPSDPGGFESIGARGCFLSHLGVLRLATSEGHQRVLLFEDDLSFPDDFNRRIEGVVSGLSQIAWSYFYGGFILDQAPTNADANGLALIPQSQGVLTAHFLGLQGPAIARTVAFLETLLTRAPGDPAGGPMHVDGAYGWYRRANPHEITLAAVPQLGYQRSSRSDIHTLRWFDRLPGFRHAVAGARQIKVMLTA